MVERISTYALHQATLRDASRVQAELAKLQTQLSSGYKSQTFTGIASQTEQLLSLEAKISRSSVYSNNNKLIQTRLDSTNAALDQVISIGSDLKSLLAKQQNPATGLPSATFQLQLNNYWDSLAQSLNVSLEGRYLFSGDRTNIAAVDAEAFPTLVDGETPDDSYYTGSDQDVTANVDDNITLTYNIRANDPAFQKIMAGLALAKKSDIEGNATQLQSAYDLIQEGLSGVITLQSSVNSNKVSLDQINLRHQGLQLYWKGLKEDIVNTDLVSASTQVAVDQGILTAAFQSFARINSLSLSSFLR